MVRTTPALQEPPESWLSIYTSSLKNCGSIPMLVPGRETTRELLYCLPELSSGVRIARIPPPILSNVAFISCMGERISRQSNYISDHQRLFVDAKSAQDDIRVNREELEVFSHPTLERNLDRIRNL